MFWAWCSHPCVIPPPGVWAGPVTCVWPIVNGNRWMWFCMIICLHRKRFQWPPCWSLLPWGTPWGKEVLMPNRTRGQPLANRWKKQKYLEAFSPSWKELNAAKNSVSGGAHLSPVQPPDEIPALATPRYSRETSAKDPGKVHLTSDPQKWGDKECVLL